MTQAYRTSSGGRIRRDQPIRFSFDGRQFTGYAGDTLASALLANGVHLVARSFKYHRPRGVLSAGSEEPNALVTIDRGNGRVTPNQRATTIELYEGLTARTQNAWPSVRFDVAAAADFLSPLLSAGFYYKTFMWPAAFWQRLYEPAIRAVAGLGRAPREPDPDRYLHRYAHCDVLVIGAGPAGLAAAAAAAAKHQRVILCDEQAEAGGSLLSRPDTRIDGLAASDWIAASLGTGDDRSEPHNGFWLVPRQHGRSGGTGNRSPCKAQSQPAARTVVAGSGAARRHCIRGNRASFSVSGQRSAGHHAGGRGGHLFASLRCHSRPPRCRQHIARQRVVHCFRVGGCRDHDRSNSRSTCDG